MAETDRYSISTTGYTITDEVYNVTGTGTQAFGDTYRKRAVYETGLEVWTGSGKTGTQLVLNTDYEFKDQDVYYTNQLSDNVYSGWALINTGSYNGVDLYFTYTTIGTYTSAEDINKISIDTEAISASETISTNVNGPVHVKLVTTGASDRTITLDSAADRENEIYTFKKVDSGAGVLIIDGEGVETIDGETTVTIRKQYTSIDIISDGTEWHIINELNNEVYETAYISNSDWTDQLLGTTAGAAVTHGLDGNIRDFEIEVYISSDGTDNNSYLVYSGASHRPVDTNVVNYGIGIEQVDSDTFNVRTGDGGIQYLNTSGIRVILGASSAFYYKLYVKRKRVLT